MRSAALTDLPLAAVYRNHKLAVMQHIGTGFLGNNLKPLVLVVALERDRVRNVHLSGFGFSKQFELPKGGCLFIDDEVRRIPRAVRVVSMTPH